MLVINDNPIKIVDSFAFAGLKHVKFLLLSSSVKHLHTVSSAILRQDHSTLALLQDAFNGLESVEHLKLDFLNLNHTLPHTFRGLQVGGRMQEPCHRTDFISYIPCHRTARRSPSTTRTLALCSRRPPPA